MITQREEQCNDHKLYKDAVEKVRIWLSHANEKIPSMKERSLSDKLAIENLLTPLESVLSTKVQGENLIENVTNRCQIILPNLSPEGQMAVNAEMADLRKDFESFFAGTCFKTCMKKISNKNCSIIFFSRCDSAKNTDGRNDRAMESVQGGVRKVI